MFTRFGGRALLRVAGAVLLSGAALGQAETLLSEDFENGVSGWTFTGTPQVLWHWAQAGECTSASISKMIAYNRFPAVCDYNTGSANSGTAQSPTFQLTGLQPWFVTFSYVHQPEFGDQSQLWQINVATGFAFQITLSLQGDGQLHSISRNLNGSSSFPAGSSCRLEFRQVSNATGNLQHGWMVDNVVVMNSGCIDTDGDGTCDSNDGCPTDPNKIAPGQCGC